MEPGHLRQRRGLVENADDKIDSNSADSNASPTPTSSVEQELTEVREEETSDPARLRGLLAKILPPKGGKNNAACLPEEQEDDHVKGQHLENDFAPGIPRLAKLQDSNDSLSMFRRFSPDAARLLIHEQIEIEQISKKLHQLDSTDAKDDVLRYRLNSIEEYKGWNPEQKVLMEDMKKKLDAYWDFLLKYVKIKALAPVAFHDHKSVQNWFLTQDEYPLADGQDDFLFNREDLAAARRKGSSAKPPTGLRKHITNFIANNPTSWFAKRFREGGAEKRTDNKMTHHFSIDQIISTVEIVFSFGSLALILLPIFLMVLKTFRREVLVVIIAIFIPLFMVYIAAIGGLQGHDVVMCTATYATILVAVLGNTSGLSVVTCGCSHSS
ncbi:hypothetical protein BGZ60DRAFT_523527 [Tricladium varicosporioides]|nr:hypothetical protein BGZ60DRAFT_523527 [Hymenoscyphus varicosporioides]